MKNKLSLLMLIAATQCSPLLQTSDTPNTSSDLHPSKQAVLLSILANTKVCASCKIQARDEYKSLATDETVVLPADHQIKLQSRAPFNNPKPICPICSLKNKSYQGDAPANADIK